MAGGIAAQAKRRSGSSDGNNGTSNESASVHVEGASSQIAPPEPNQEELLSELAKKRTLGLTMPQKTQQVIKPIVEGRASVIEAAKNQSTPNLALKLSGVILLVTPKTLSGDTLAKLLLDMHSALKCVADNVRQPTRSIMNPFQSRQGHEDGCIELSVERSSETRKLLPRSLPHSKTAQTPTEWIHSH